MPKRYPGIRHIKDNVYEISYYPYAGAKRKQYRIRAGSIKEAFLIRAEHMAGGPHSKSEDTPSFSELWEKLEVKLKADNVRAKTLKNTRSVFRNFFEKFLPAKRPDLTGANQITSNIIEEYKQWVVVEQGRVNGWREELGKLKTMFNKLVAIGCCDSVIQTEVFAKFKKPKGRRRGYKEITRNEMLSLLNFIKKDRPDYYGPTYIIMRFGWRRTQALSIKRHNIKWLGLKPVEILIEPQDTKTNEPFIYRDIDEEFARIIKRYAFDRRKTQWLFPNRDGNIIHGGHYTEYIKRVSEKIIGKQLTPHEFRHSFCTRMLREGHAERDIMAVTGHKDIDSFKIYAHSTSEGTKQVIEQSKLMGGGK